MRLWKRVRMVVLLGALLLLSIPAMSTHSEPPSPWTATGTGLPKSCLVADDEVTLTLIGRVLSTQDAPINEAEVGIFVGKITEVVQTDVEGFYIVDMKLPLPLVESGAVTIEINKPGFRVVRQDFTGQEIARANDRCYTRLPDIVLPRILNAAFFAATIIFVLVFGLISLNIVHETIAAFLGAAAMLGISYLVGSFHADFWIISFERAIAFVDFDVIFLIMTLMIVVSIIGRTGLFQWLAMAAYRAAHGSAWRLAVLLMAATAAMSAFLNNVTIMLLMAPITIEIALMLEINPTSLLIPEAMASNIGGIATLIGDPPNTIIGSYAGLGFNQFLAHLGPVALLATVALVVVIYLVYRREYALARRSPSPALMARLEKDAQITDPVTLRRAVLVVSLMMALFFTSEFFHIPPSVVGFIGATILLVWVQPDVEEMLNEVDWTTLMFFICLFMVVGGVQEVGLIQGLADLMAGLAGDDLFVASQTVIWLSAAASAIVNNIPFTTAVLPIAGFLTQAIPSARNLLYWSLSLGANLGGNATYVGSAPNVVAVGYLERAGYRVTFGDWLKIGLPVTLVTILIPTLWLVVRYFWLQF
jgi:Na+/H+ antiporter NhaD/arsenite permease-like protein